MEVGWPGWAVGWVVGCVRAGLSEGHTLHFEEKHSSTFSSFEVVGYFPCLAEKQCTFGEIRGGSDPRSAFLVQLVPGVALHPPRELEYNPMQDFEHH